MIMMKILKGVHIIAAPAGWQVTTRDTRVLKRNVSVTRGVFLVLLQEMQPGKILTHTPLQHTYKLPTILNGIEISDVLTK